MKKLNFLSTGLRFLWLAILVYVVDIASKVWVLSSLTLHDPHPVLPFFNIMYAQNFGAAFSLFWGQRWVLALIAAIVSGIILSMLYKNPAQDRINNCALALVLGGALGNLSDRLYHGFVVDFLDVVIFNWHYPTFNIADSAICIGAFLLILAGFKKKEKSNEASK